ncbi:transcriptional regulator, GntR family with UTRA sensor domain containing protein [Desulfovibrio sp. X2]|uniref:phosphonate metabolism transcriptional regulator PhnF n=1 Tax=Desulfovibrio sp. X2 TaxID=941449 RepID=UPI00035887FC|nr:phosphonate metabolism transcriptional regulator PhnF [Desulfovibrio sp. X2]EPR43825.1 transcriptional regulator, GntR family with UTRA sensor domain containing protein [Desulfovibrio sp. X2]
MTLERGSGVALWRQIRNVLEHEIADAGQAEDGRLPTEKELSERFGVNRHTVRRALAVLEAEGLIVVEQGRGAFVRPQMVSYQLARRVRFSQNLLRQSRAPRGRLLEASVVRASAEAAKALHVAQNDPVCRLEILGQADGVPLSIGTSHFSGARFPGLVEAYRESGSITEALRACGLPDYVRKSTLVTARMPTPREARLLGQPRSRPVLVAESVNVDAQGRPVEWGICRWASERVQLAVEPERDLC